MPAAELLRAPADSAASYEHLSTVVTGPLAVDLASLLVSVDGRVLPLTATETRIAVYLARRIGQLCSHDEILASAWGPAYRGEAHLLRVNMARLRFRLGQAAGLIQTHHGLGYRLLSVEPGAAVPEPETIWPAPERWSARAPACRGCGLTERRHHWRGYCGGTACRALASAERAEERRLRVD